MNTKALLLTVAAVATALFLSAFRVHADEGSQAGSERLDGKLHRPELRIAAVGPKPGPRRLRS